MASTRLPTRLREVLWRRALEAGCEMIILLLQRSGLNGQICKLTRNIVFVMRCMYIEMTQRQALAMTINAIGV